MTNEAAGEPQDPTLWRLTLAAVRAAGVAADEHLENGGYRHRVSMPRVATFKGGWPDLSTSFLTASNGPTDFSALFGRSRDTLHHFAYDDVPELRAVIDYVRASPTLSERLGVTTRSGNPELADRMFTYQVADLPLSILDRARATGATTDDDLLSLYLFRERAWLLESLPVEYVVPMTLTAVGLDEPLWIDETIRIEPMDAATQAARAPSRFSIAAVPTPVISAATHAIVFSDHHDTNPGPWSRLVLPDESLIPLGDVDVVFEALRVVTDADVGYAQVLSRPVGWADSWTHDLPPMTAVATVRRYPERFDDNAWEQPPGDPISHAELNMLGPVLSALCIAPPRLRLAARRLSLAVSRPADDDRIVDACIGLEALLGEGRDELSHRIGLRAATALASRPGSKIDAAAAYDIVKTVYKHRSDVVHGTPADKSRTMKLGEHVLRTADVAVILLRSLLADVLTRPKQWTPKTLDADLFEALTKTYGADTQREVEVDGGTKQRDIGTV